MHKQLRSAAIGANTSFTKGRLNNPGLDNLILLQLAYVASSLVQHRALQILTTACSLDISTLS